MHRPRSSPKADDSHHSHSGASRSSVSQPAVTVTRQAKKPTQDRLQQLEEEKDAYLVNLKGQVYLLTIGEYWLLFARFTRD